MGRLVTGALRLAATAAIVWSTGCESEPALRSCEQDLGGTYRSTRGGYYHLLEDRGRLSIYTAGRAGDTLAGATRTSPAWIELVRRPDGIHGARQYRRTVARTPCQVREPATLTSCRNALTIEHGVAGPPGDACSFTVQGTVTLKLERVRAYRL